MAPWDAGVTFRIGSRPEVLYAGTDCVVLSCRPVFGGLARACVIDLYAGVSTIPVEIMVEDFLELASTDSRGRDYCIVLYLFETFVYTIINMIHKE